MKAILTLVLCWGFVYTTVAQSKTDSLRYMQNRKNLQAITQAEPMHYKIGYEQFYVNYVFDDTSRALVNMYFRKRRNSWWGGFGIYSGTLALSLIGSKQQTVCVTPPSFGTCQATKERVYQPWVAPVVGIAMVGSIAYQIARRTTFSQKTLLLQLIDYERGKTLPPKTLQRLTVQDFQ